MPEQADSPPADATVDQSAGHAVNGSRRDPFWDRDDALEATPLQKEIMSELLWAADQQAKGHFTAYLGQYVAIVNKAVLAVGGDISRMVAEAVVKTGVARYRVAIYYVDDGEW